MLTLLEIIQIPGGNVARLKTEIIFIYGHRSKLRYRNMDFSNFEKIYLSNVFIIGIIKDVNQTGTMECFYQWNTAIIIHCFYSPPRML